MTLRLESLILTAVLAALLLPVAGCMTFGTPTPMASAEGSTPPSRAGGGQLTFDLVQRRTAKAFVADPNCAYGQWNENSTGVEEEFRSAVVFFRQFDCYQSKEDVGGIPERGRQSIYVEFADRATARNYAEAEAVLYRSLLEDRQVVTVGTGLDEVDMLAYLAGLRSDCTCGELIELR